MILSTFDALNFVIKRVLTLVRFYIFCFFHTFSSWCQSKLTLGFLPFIPIKKIFFQKKNVDFGGFSIESSILKNKIKNLRCQEDMG